MSPWAATCRRWLPAAASGSSEIRPLPELPAMDAFGALIEEGKLHEARPLLQAALLLMPQNASALYFSTGHSFDSGTNARMSSRSSDSRTAGTIDSTNASSMSVVPHSAVNCE